MSRDVSEQRRIARIALEAAGPEAGFALAGSGAIREHGFINCPVENVDLFTIQSAQHEFTSALERVIAALQETGYDVEIRRQHPRFSRLVLSRGSAEPVVTVDLGVDWRVEDPVRLTVRPVLAPDDVVGNKVAALFSRGEARDYLDVDRTRASGRYQDRRLIELGHRADLGFEITQFVRRLGEVGRIQPSEVAIYEVSPEQLRAVKDRCLAWARELCARPVGDPIPPCGQVAGSDSMPDSWNWPTLWDSVERERFGSHLPWSEPQCLACRVMRNALLEVDWQNWALALAHDPQSAHLGREARRLLANLDWPVISTRYLSPTPGGDRADPGHPDAVFVDGFEPRGQPVIAKYDRDVFDVAQTDETLRGLGVERIVLTGLVTDHGIRPVALSALDRGYAVTVVSNACADTTGEAHPAALDELRTAGVVARSADDLVASVWRRAGSIVVRIAEVADIIGLSRDTLRWYERERLIPMIDRTSNGYRRYNGRATRMVQMLVRLRRTEIPVEQMREYITLVAGGESSHRHRLALFRRYRDAVQQQLDQLVDDLGALDHKVTNYERALGK